MEMDDDVKTPLPGEILKMHYLETYGVSAYRLAKETGMPLTRIAAILHGRRRITADTALRFGRFFGTGPELWLALQDDWDIETELQKMGKEFDGIVPLDEPMHDKPVEHCSVDDLPSGWRMLERPYRTKK